MKKRILSLMLIIALMIPLFAVNTTIVSAATITEASFASKIAELQNTFIDGQYWNKYSSSDYSRTGTVKCKCSGSYCAGTCSCSCGQFYHNGKWYGGQCHGYALKLGYLIFGNVATVSWTKHKNAYNVYAGDLVRINNDGHSFFIYKVVGDTIYYTECNNSAPCQVKWGRTMSKATLASKVTYILHNPNYSLTGTGSAPSAPVVNPIHSDTSAHIRNGFFTLKNVASGSYMNVYNGTDANKTAITMWGYDDSTDQQFNVVHQGNGKYKLYAYCSSNGTNRVVDVYRNGAAPAAGQLVDLWTPDDDTAQLFYIVPLDDGSYVFELASKDGYVIAPTSASAAGTNGSQLTLQLYTGANYQKWKFCNNNGRETHPVGSYSADSYKVNTNGVNLTMRSGAGSGYSKVTSIPDTTILNITQVNSNWGYTTYNGYSGWVCLDFTIYTPTITSISMHNAPYINRYFVGESLDKTGMEITATYSNGSTKNITSGFTTSYDFSTAGTKTVTVTYSGKTTSFTVEVVNPTIEDLEITAPATKTSYSVGDTIDTKGLTLKAIYNNGSEKTVTSCFTADYDFSASGTKTVTIEYEGLTVSYNVTVEAVGTAVISLTSPASAKKGDLIDVVVKLSNSQNMYDGNFVITYDNEVLKLKGNSIGSSLTNQNPTLNTTHAQNKIKLSYAGTNVVSNGNMLSLTFEVISDSKTSTNIEISEVNMYNISGNKVNVTKSNSPCSINISKTQENADAIFTLSDVSGKPGDTVKVKLSLKSSQSLNTIAISGISFSDALTFEGFSDYEEISNLAAITPTFDETNKAIVVGLRTATAFDGDICTLNFKIDEDAEEGELFVSANSVVKLNSTNISSTVKSSTVTVRTQVLGDVNGDENVDLQDAIALLNHSMLPEIYSIPYVGSVDFNKDGSVDLQDAILLLNYSMLPDIYPIG